MEVSNPEKVLFGGVGVTKSHLVAHYEAVGSEMLRFVADSPLTLERYPNGIGEKGFRQKNASKHFPDFIGRIEIPKRNDGVTTYPTVDSVEGLAYLANQGTITFHPWTSRLPDLDRPDHLVLDLDPTEGDARSARAVAHACRAVLDRFGLEAVPVASGSKGYHLWVPIEPLGFDDVALSARALAGLVVTETEAATTEFLKADRNGRVFVDWLRNNPGASIASPLSVRARPGAPVATPVTWDLLDHTEPDEYSIQTLDDRPAVTWPEPASLPAGEIASEAGRAGVDLDTPFDRFGR